jgi:cell division septation protein DedD
MVAGNAAQTASEKGREMVFFGIRQVMAAGCAALVLAGCEPGQNPFAKLGAGGGETAEGEAVAPATSVRLVDTDVEAPEVFQVTDEALWDGRPSLGGVWVASPDAVDPERVILRNPENGKFVIGALFRRERDNPGPKLQISSDAASALGVLAGQPVTLNVTALRREEAPAVTEPDQPILDEAETVETTGIDAVATAAIDEAEASAPAIPTAPAASAADATPAPTALAAPAASAGTGSLIQIGFYSIEANAQRAVDTLKAAGITASLRKEDSNGKPFWSVTARGDSAVLAKIKAAGFADAYVTKS